MAMTVASGDAVFLDTNILLRYNIADFPEHQDVRVAVNRLIEAEAILWISRQVVREFAAVTTRPQSFMSPLSPKAAAERLRSLTSGLRVADDTEVVSKKLFKLMDTYPMGGKQIHDANIVATMQSYGITHLFTLNTVDFARFSTLITLVTLDSIIETGE